MKVRRLTYKVLLASALIVMAACNPKAEPLESGQPITFCVGTQPTKATIENTSALISKNLPIYVVGPSDIKELNDVEIKHSGNGIWRSEATWESGREYSFYAYVSSPGSGSDASVKVADGSKGCIVDVSQPSSYSDSYTDYSDYFLSYQVTADGSSPGLVYLDLERVTSCVELYIAMSAGMTQVTLEKVEFSGIMRTARFSTDTPAQSGAQAGSNGMKNQWTLSRSGNPVTYSLAIDDSNKSLDVFDSSTTADGDFNYDTKYRKMSFLVIPQPTYQEMSGYTRQIKLSLTYKVQETVDGQTIERTYSPEFNLSDYSPATWTRGHKVRYYINIDSGIKLTGSIVKWEEVDFIEGTLLPE